MSSPKKYKNLILFTTGYPYGWYETVFLQHEIKIASERFEKIIIVYHEISGILQPLPKNVLHFNLKDFKTEKITKVKTYRLSFSFLYNWFIEFLSNKAIRVKLNILKNLLNDFSLYKNQYENFKKLQILLERNSFLVEETIFYTYWFDQRSVMLKFLKDKHKAYHVTRAHGFDVYKERSKSGYISFRSMHVKTVDKIFCVSKSGCDYLKNIYKKQAGKIFFSRLGSEDCGLNPFIKEPYHIVSCSSLFKVKRVPLIVDILIHMKENILWTHIGSMGEEAQLLEKVKELPKNITFRRTGEIDNDVTLNFYKTNPINLFINVSESEGLPFSIIEAISFGIPCIATNVGGTKEAVTEQTGMLLDKDFKPQETAALISEFLHSDKNSIDFRKSVRNHWENNFNAKNNYTDFLNRISNS